MPSLQELANEVLRESQVLEDSLSLWRRSLIGKTRLKKERAVLAAKYGEARLDRALELLEQLYSLLSQCSPAREEFLGRIDVGQETALAQEKFKKTVPDVPDKVLNRLTSLYAFYAR